MNMGKKIAGLFALSAICTSAWADGTWVNCLRAGSIYQYFSLATINVGKDAAVTDVVGPWQTSLGPNVWNCTPLASSQNRSVEMAVSGLSPNPYLGYTIDVDGESYMVFNVTEKEGLGYIARWRYTLKGQTSTWTPLTARNGLSQHAAQRFPVSYNNGTYFTISTEVQVRFVKTTTRLVSGTITAFNPILLRHFQIADGSGSEGLDTHMIARFQEGGLYISTINGTCTTPNVTVTLPEASASEFTGPGYTTARQAFALKFSQCPAGLASISYTFTPTTTVLDSANGVVALDSTSSATGVGIQLLTESDTPVTYDSAYLLMNYDALQPNTNYTVPMTAGLYQTGASITPGAANSAVNFTLTYK